MTAEDSTFGDDIDEITPLAQAVTGDDHRAILVALSKRPLDAAAAATAGGCEYQQAADFLQQLVAVGLARQSAELYAATEMVEVDHDGPRIRIRVSNDEGDFVEVKYSP